MDEFYFQSIINGATTMGQYRNMPLDYVELTVRAVNRLHSIGVTTVGQMIDKTDEELLNIKGLGRETLEDIRRYRL